MWIPSLVPVVCWVLGRQQFLTSSLSIILQTFATSDVNGQDLDRNTACESSQQVRREIHALVTQDPALAGQFVRLAFHDSTTRDGALGGPNGSLLYELERSENRGLAKPLMLLVQEKAKHADFSLADIIALAGAQAIETVGGPSISIRLGRKDVEMADPEFLQRPMSASTPRSMVTKTLPSAGLDSDGLRLYFRNIQLSEPEWIALTGGSHGLGRHVSLLGMPKDCLKNLTRTCLEDAPILLPFVTDSVYRFDNTYFQALLQWNDNQIEMGKVAFIPTDVAMVVDQGLRVHVRRFANDNEYFRRTFSRAYQKMVEATATSRNRY